MRGRRSVLRQRSGRGGRRNRRGGAGRRGERSFCCSLREGRGVQVAFELHLRGFVGLYIRIKWVKNNSGLSIRRFSEVYYVERITMLTKSTKQLYRTL